MKSVAIALLLAVPAVVNAAPTSDTVAIKAAIATQDNAYDAGDLQKYMKIFATDFLSFSLGAPSRGQDKKSTLVNLRNVFQNYSTHSSDDIQEMTVSGKIARVRSNFNITLSPKSGGKMQQYSGYDIEIWEKGEDGQWRITRYVGIPNRVNCPH